MTMSDGIDWIKNRSDSTVASYQVPEKAEVEVEFMPKKANEERLKAPKHSNHSVTNKVYEMQARICKALAHPSRMHIMDLLGKREHTVSELQKQLCIPLPTVSIQIAILRTAGIVETRKEGKNVYCSLAVPEIKQACHLVHCVLRSQIRNAQKLPI
jgi:DNA-binding transcriptional ArsR family regulator